MTVWRQMCPAFSLYEQTFESKVFNSFKHVNISICVSKYKSNRIF